MLRNGLPAAGEVVLGRAQLAALERGPRIAIVGPEPERLGVLDHGQVVVLAMFGVAAATQRTRGGVDQCLRHAVVDRTRHGARDEAHHHQRDDDAVEARASAGMGP